MGISDKDKGRSGRENGGKRLKEKRRNHFQGLSSSLDLNFCLVGLEIRSQSFVIVKCE